jgi:hypothetical protein
MLSSLVEVAPDGNPAAFLADLDSRCSPPPSSQAFAGLPWGVPVRAAGGSILDRPLAGGKSDERERRTGMHCGVMVTGYNQGDWERLLAEDYSRPPAVSDAANMDDTLFMGELVEPLGFDSIWATEHYGSAYSMQPNPLQYLA